MVDLPTVGHFVGGAGYAPLTETSLRALVSGVPACSDLMKSDPADWKIREVGDGNLNLVFIVTSGAAGVVVKQALPYVRLVGESWPLRLDRAHFRAGGTKDPGSLRADACSEGHPAQRINPAGEISPAGGSPFDLPGRNPVPHVRSRHVRRCQEGGGGPVMPELRLVQNQRRPLESPP